MPTIAQQDNRPPEPINFLVPADFKLELDLEVKRQRTSMREFCTRAIAEKLGIPVPGEEPDPPRKRARG